MKSLIGMKNRLNSYHQKKAKKSTTEKNQNRNPKHKTKEGEPWKCNTTNMLFLSVY